MKFSTTTDIWSFGVVLLEIVTGGKRPYDDMRNEQVIAMVMAGHRAQRPDTGCSVELYAIMLQCWAEDAKQRPPFAQIATMIEFEQNKAVHSGSPGGAGTAFSFGDAANAVVQQIRQESLEAYLIPGSPADNSLTADGNLPPQAPPRTLSSGLVLEGQEDSYLQVGSSNGGNVGSSGAQQRDYSDILTFAPGNEGTPVVPSRSNSAPANEDQYLVPGTPLAFSALGEPEYDTSDLTVAELLAAGHPEPEYDTSDLSVAELLAAGQPAPLGEPEYDTSDLATSGDVVYTPSDRKEREAAAAMQKRAELADQYSRIVPKTKRGDGGSGGGGGGSRESTYSTASHKEKSSGRPVSSIYSTAVHTSPPTSGAATNGGAATGAAKSELRSVPAPALPHLPLGVLSAIPTKSPAAPPPPTRLAPLPPPTAAKLASAAFAPAPKLIPKQKSNAAVEAAFATAAAESKANANIAKAAVNPVPVPASAPVAAPRGSTRNDVAAAAAPTAAPVLVLQKLPKKSTEQAKQPSRTLVLNQDPMAPISI